MMAGIIILSNSISGSISTKIGNHDVKKEI